MLTDDEVASAIRGMLRRVSVVSVDDSGPQQLLTLSGLSSEQLTKVVRSQPFGFSSVPPPGAEGLLAPQGGRSDRSHVLGLEHPKYRPTGVEVGGTVVYDMHGNAVSIVLKQLRIVHSQQIEFVAPKIILNGKCLLGGEDAAIPAAMRGTLDTAGNADDSNLATMVLVK